MLSDWWNGVELWISGLPFPFQFALVIVVLAPVCLVVAWLIDRIVDHLSAWFGPADAGERPLGSSRPPEDAEKSGNADEVGETESASEERVPARSSR